MRPGRKRLHGEKLIGVHWSIRPDQRQHVARRAEAAGQYESEYIRDLLDRDMQEQTKEGD